MHRQSRDIDTVDHDLATVRVHSEDRSKQRCFPRTCPAYDADLKDTVTSNKIDLFRRRVWGRNVSQPPGFRRKHTACAGEQLSVHHESRR